MFGCTWLRVLILSLALASSTGLAAQTPDAGPGADSVRYLGGITVDVARPALTRGGSSAVVVDLDSLPHLPAPSLEDVVRSLPLVQVRTNSRGEAQPALRGANDRQLAVILDGVPLTLGWDHRTDLSLIPMTAARSVTLVRGLSSVLYGPNTLGGVIEVDMARVGRRVTSVDPVSVGLSLDGTGGTHVSALAGHVTDGATDQWVVRGGLGFQDRPGSPLPSGLADEPGLRTRFLGDGDRRLNSDVRRLDGFALARYRADDGAWASVSLTGVDSERGVPPEAHQDNPRLWRYPNQRRALVAASAGTGRRTTGGGVGGVEASLGVDYGTTLLERFASEAYRTVAETEESEDRVVTARLLGEHSLGGAADLRVAATVADVSHDEARGGGTPDTFSQRIWSLGAEAGLSFGPGERTTVSLGAAVDGAGTQGSSGLPALEGMSDYGLRVGASSLVLPRLLLHGGVSRRARFPSLREIYSTGLGRFEANPSLRPETLVGSEVGLTARSGAGEVQFVGFHHRLDQGIVRAAVTGADGVPRLRRVNQAEVRSSGLELLLVGQVGQTTVTGDLTVQSVRGEDGAGVDVPIEYEPSVLARARVDAPVGAGLRGTAELRYVGRQHCVNPEAGGLQGLPESASVDLAVRRDFGFGGGALSGVSAQASVWNATDAATFDQCGLPRPGRLFEIQFRLW